ncbi:MAG: DUF4129 domain-containing protein [Bacteroidota bacterium]
MPRPSPLLLLRLSVLALVFATAVPALAQTKPTETATSERSEKIERAAALADKRSVSVAALPRDSSALAPRAVATPVLDGFRADPDFAYDRVVTQQPSLWDRLMQWLNDRFFRPAGESVSPDVQRWVIYGIAIAALVFAFLKLLGADFGGVFQRRERAAATVEALDDLTALDEVDLGALLTDAERTEAWPLAVRLRYLRLLQALAERDLIVWAPATTNRAYALALEGGSRADLVPAFRDLTRLFEAAWYGDFNVDAALYAEVRRRFAVSMEDVAQTALSAASPGSASPGSTAPGAATTDEASTQPARRP